MPQAAAGQAKADVAAGKAAVQTAQINLGYAAVTSPISGRIGRALVTEGALVGQGEATPLAVVQQIDKLYVNFTQPANEVMRLRKALAAGQLQRAAGKEAAQVQVVLEDGSVYPQPGKLLFSDLSVDPATGQITLRAELPNPQGQLLPGLYVRVRLALAEVADGIWLPQQAVARTPQGDTVLVVGRRRRGQRAARQAGPAAHRAVAGAVGPEAGREGHRRRPAEGARRRQGQAGGVDATGCRLHTRARCLGRFQGLIPSWRSSSSTGPSLRGSSPSSSPSSAASRSSSCRSRNTRRWRRPPSRCR